MTSSRILVDGAEKSYGAAPVLREVNLRVDGPGVVGIVGPNGVGKTTLIRLLVGLHGPDVGIVRVLDADPRVLRPGRGGGSIGYVPQDIGIYPTLTVAENLRTFAGLNRAEASFAVRRDEVAELLALGDLLERPAWSLSGGEQRRVHVAAALLHEPTVLLVDEPTVGADVAARRRILEAVRNLADTGTTVVYTTHYLSELEAIGDDVLVLCDGRVADRGSPAELVARHGQATIEVTSSMVLNPAFFAPLGEITQSEPNRVVLRPESAPSVALAGLAAQLGSELPEDSQIELRQPSLEQAYLALTARSLTSFAEPEIVR